MIWGYITKWFNDFSERSRTIKEFNVHAKQAFIIGETPILMEAKITMGNSSYKHAFSKMMSGFRIKVLSGRELSRDEMMAVSSVIMNDEILVRRLVSLGWDTLEIYGMQNSKGLQFRLMQYVALLQ